MSMPSDDVRPGGAASRPTQTRPAPGSPTGVGTRRPGLDAARALAVGLMVVGHTLDAVLDPTTRESPGVVLYWHVRSTTAALFLLVAGFAFALTVTRTAPRAAELGRRYLPRVGLLLFWAFLLRLPFWGLRGLVEGDRAVWAHLLGFDALHCIAFSLLATVGLFAALSRPSLRQLSLVVATLLVVGLAAPVAEALSGPEGPVLLQQSLGGGTAGFPLLPWSGFFFLGALIALVLPSVVEVRRSAAALLVGGILVAAVAFSSGSGDVPATHPLYFVQRVGMGTLALGVAALLPLGLQRALSPWGRASLGVYVAHLPVVYGWGFWPGLSGLLGRTQGLLPALGLGLGMLVASLLVGRYVPHGWRALRARRGATPASPEKGAPLPP